MINLQNEDYRKRNRRGSSPSILEAELQSDNLGADWIELFRKIRNDDSKLKTKAASGRANTKF